MAGQVDAGHFLFLAEKLVHGVGGKLRVIPRNGGGRDGPAQVEQGNLSLHVVFPGTAFGVHGALVHGQQLGAVGLRGIKAARHDQVSRPDGQVAQNFAVKGKLNGDDDYGKQGNQQPGQRRLTELYTVPVFPPKS